VLLLTSTLRSVWLDELRLSFLKRALDVEQAERELSAVRARLSEDASKRITIDRYLTCGSCLSEGGAGQYRKRKGARTPDGPLLEHWHALLCDAAAEPSAAAVAAGGETPETTWDLFSCCYVPCGFRLTHGYRTRVRIFYSGCGSI
jgi:hypothetical protein